MNNLKVKRYIEKADRYITQAEKEFKKGELCQASEKYWGASAQILKAWAEYKGIQHNGHIWLFKAADELAEEIKEPAIRKQFSLASALHMNFYEGWLTEREVRDDAFEVKLFCDKIKQILTNKEEKK
ncbi:MAG: PaREP1 family protein [bacterium]